MKRLALLLALASTAATFACVPATATPNDVHGWTKVGETRPLALSGVAFERREGRRTDFLVVHDNKKPDQPRIGRVSVTADGAKYAPLAWPAGAEWPVDLEAICPVPKKPGRFAMIASEGKLFTVDVEGEKVALVGGAVDLPAAKGLDKPNYESFTLQEIGGALVAVWADRGEKTAPARLFWGPFDASKGPSIAGESEIRVPWPEADRTRDVADLEVDALGVVWAAAAWDDDKDDSTYRSAAYVIGVLTDGSSATGFRAAKEPMRWRTFPDRKLEALEMVPGPDGGAAFGSDDEDHGGWFLFE